MAELEAFLSRNKINFLLNESFMNVKLLLKIGDHGFNDQYIFAEINSRQLDYEMLFRVGIFLYFIIELSFADLFSFREISISILIVFLKIYWQFLSTVNQGLKLLLKQSLIRLNFWTQIQNWNRLVI